MSSAEASTSGKAGHEEFDRTGAHGWAKSHLQQLRGAERQVGRSRKRLTKQVREARRRYRVQRTRQRLESLSVQDLLRGSRTRISVPALIAAGVCTAQDVLSRDINDLKAIPGLGEKGIPRLLELARQASRVQSADLRPPADPAAWRSADVDLVRLLQSLAAAVSLVASPHLAVVQHAIVMLRSFAWATNWLRWLFSGAARKREVGSRESKVRAEFNSVDASSALHHLLGGLDRLRRLADSPRAQVEAVWREQSTDLQALLDQFMADDGSPDEQAAARHGRLPEDLVEQIENTPLDESLVERNLRVYQKFGVKFALYVGRTLLGDDMGLGKTVQALAAIAHATQTDGQPHHLVVCPATLVDNWLQEISQTVPALERWAFRGKEPARTRTFEDWTTRGGILIVSYEQTEPLLERSLPPLGFVVVDEAHMVKTPTAKRTVRIRQLVASAHRALLMSGTMLENRPQEMIELAGLVDPEQGKRLRARFGDGQNAHLEADEFRGALAALYLRRNKNEMLTELPDLHFHDLAIEIGEDERLACKTELASSNNPAAALMRARPALTVGAGRGSQKIDRLRDIVEACKSEKHKVLIFSFFRSVLAVAQETVESVAPNNPCCLLHGDLSAKQKLEAVERFHDAAGFAALVAQIQVGGQGLNLQAATTVVLMEPQYKPSTEWQAVNRAHRQGQTRAVTVYRLIARDSPDERIVELTDAKAELFNELARRSSLAEASLEARDGRLDLGQLFANERKRFELPPPEQEDSDR